LKRIRIDASKSYTVAVGSGCVAELGRELKAVAETARVMIVSDDNVYPLYGEKVRKVLETAGYTASQFVFPHGEAHKNLDTYGLLLEQLCAENYSRSDLILALGGGVTGDLAGFAAATYQRGIRFVQLPTTLLAAVDASVGGKTAVDLKGGKNQVGAFCQPSLVLCDTELLSTLPDTEFRAGMAEVIKYGAIGDSELFKLLENTDMETLRKGGDNQLLEAVIARCVEQKKQFVQNDEFDTGSRMLLNFGHTFGHGIEAASGFRVPHGYAVAAGMCIISRAAETRGLCGRETRRRIEALTEKYGLPTGTEFTGEQMLPYIASDKKVSGRQVKLVVTDRIGHAGLVPVNVAELSEWLKDGGVK